MESFVNTLAYGKETSILNAEPIKLAIRRVEMNAAREMTLEEWCESLPAFHLVNKEYAALIASLKGREREIEQLKIHYESEKRRADDWAEECTQLQTKVSRLVSRGIEDLRYENEQLQEQLAKYESAECNDPVAWPAIVENKRLRVGNKEIDKLKERLEVSDDHSHDGISARDETIKLAEGKNTELKAHVERLRNGLTSSLQCVENFQLGLRSILDETPSQSLAENNRAVEAATICKCADKLEDDFTSALIDRSRAIMSIRDIPSQYKDNQG